MLTALSVVACVQLSDPTVIMELKVDGAERVGCVCACVRGGQRGTGHGMAAAILTHFPALSAVNRAV